jgi:hypothetical protein
MEATRLAPAGRACSKFVWQSCFLKTGRFEYLRIRAAPSFFQPLTDAASGLRIAAGLSVPLGLGGLAPLSICPSRRPSHFRAATRAVPAKRALPGTLLTTRSALRDPVRFLGAGHVVAAIGRHSSRPKCGDGRPGANHRWRVSGWAFRWARGGRNSLANSKRSGINSAQRA